MRNNNKKIVRDRSLNERTLEIALIDGVQSIVIPPEWDIADDAKRLLELARLILISDEKYPFRIEQSKFDKVKRIGKTNLGNKICNALKIDIVSMRTAFNTHKFHPLLELIIKTADESMLFERYRELDFSIEADAIGLVAIANGMVQKIREEGEKAEFKDKVRNFERKSKGNFLEFKRYIDAHFRKRSRLLFVRLDLGYKTTFLDSVGRDAKRVYSRIKKDWSTLHKNLNLKILKSNFMGFVWKLEYGLKKSFHLHVLFIIDNKQLKSDILIGKIVGENWEKDITGGCGDYFNCNGKKDSYRFCGIGQVHRDNAEMREILINQVGAYLTKPDYVVALETPDGGRAFGKGNMPK